MFQEYLDLVTKSNAEVVEVEKETDKSREELTIKVQKQMEAELEKIKSEDSLKNYSVVSHHNIMTQHAHELGQIQAGKASRIAEIKKILDLALYELVEKPAPKVTELYKVIGSVQNGNTYICRVWFTLVPIEKWECKPGDPIRVEWIITNGNRNSDSQGVNATAQRTSKGISGLKIPQFSSSGQINNGGSLYNPDQWGASSSQKTWWLEWVKTNRPIPE